MRPSRKAIWSAAVVFAMAAGCDKEDPTEPSGNSAATITISNNTVSPNSVTVPVGSQVTFVNNDSVGHNMNSDPHPEHTNCPALNVGTVPQNGGSRQSANLTVARTCGYHDHDRNTVQSMRGTIIVQ